jgi:general secretion pathway protein A
MYTEFFGLREKPFALLPDTRFIYLGSSHREALAHLLYGIEQGEGFIVVVGQVGTGKTTLCRTLLGRVAEDVAVAYIFNPSRSETELLASINREFGLPTAARGRPELIEQLNRFLLERKRAGHRPVLIIDEAQNLEAEILEQVRLLSNLETEREKLMQIILIGQPELGEKLRRPELRQLRQRITVRWDLRPFDRGEVREYVRHRLRVAGLAPHVEPFSPGAIGALHRASRGIPRLINAIADRVLLAGYAANRPCLRARDVRVAARELSEGRSASAGSPARGLGLGPPLVGALVAAGLVAGFLIAPILRGAPGSEPVAAAPPGARTLPAENAPAALELEPASFLGYASERSKRVTAAGALEALLRLWGYEEVVPGELDPNLFGAFVRDRSALRVLVTRVTRRQLQAIDLPAILELQLEPERVRYAALVEVSGDGTARIGLRDQTFRMPMSELAALWTGRTFFLWTNFESLPVLAPGMEGSAVRWLQARLTDLGYLREGDASGHYDGTTALAIRRFQEERALDDTGEVGPETLISLYQALRYGAPHLRSAELS